MKIGFDKESLRLNKIGKRKKYLHGLIARLMERKAILDIQRDKADKDIVKATKDLKDTVARERKNE